MYFLLFVNILFLFLKGGFGDKASWGDECSFHYWKQEWKSARQACEREHRRLLCYASRQEVDDITEAFRLASDANAELDIWLHSKNCSAKQPVPCLSLHISKSFDRIWHFFQEDCDDSFPFICCNEGVSLTSTATPAQQTTDSSVGTSKAPSHKGCRAIWMRGIRFPDTDAGEIAKVPCHGHSTGFAEWLCRNNSRWSRSGPNFQSCRSFDIATLKEKFNTSSLPEVFSMLEKVKTEDLFPSDLADVVELMSTMPGRVMHVTQNLSSSEKWTATRDMVYRSTGMMDRIIAVNETWREFETDRRASLCSNLLTTVDSMGLVLSDAMTSSRFNIRHKNVVLEVVRGSKRTSLSAMGSSSGLHIRQLSEDTSAVFVFYDDLRHVLPEAQGGGFLNSAVAGAVLTNGDGVSVPLNEGSTVEILVRHLKDNQTDACVFWDIVSHRWSSMGCKASWHNESWSLCTCNHLTNFAVLMDYSDTMVDMEDHTSFDYITVVGCSLSVVCLAICVVIFTCISHQSSVVHQTWCVRYIIHRNLCLTLLVANLLILIGLDQTERPALCACIAGFLHYFLLSAFCWMLLEGVHIYLLLVVVFAQRHSRILLYYFTGYGVPVIIVAVTAIVRPTFYGTEKVCWLSSEKGTIWAFMGPVAIILTLNTAALILAQYKASRISNKDNSVALFRRWLRVTVILFPVLGLTWVLGFVYVGKHQLAVGYAFAVLNSLQGVFIFVCHCLLDKKARSIVLSSFKKKSSSVNTTSSNTRKKQSSNISSVNGLSPNSPSGAQAESKRWFVVRRWKKPWTYCLDLSVPHSPPDDKTRH